MKSKAKTLDEKWVEGWFDGSEPERPIMWVTDNEDIEYGYGHFEIDPSTLCQQVRGTEFFEGDEVEFEYSFFSKTLMLTGYIIWNDYRWSIEDKDGGKFWLLEAQNLKPTGKNKHDL